MTISYLPLKQAPALVKVSVGFFALHTGLYIAPVIVALLSGATTYPMWFLHIGICTYMFTQFSRARKDVFYTIVAYCLVIPTQMLSAEYVSGRAFVEALSLMSDRILILCAPMYLAALFLIAGRRFYFAPPPSSSTSTDAAR